MKKCLLSLAVSLLLGSSLASAEFVKAPVDAPKTPTVAQSRAATDDGYQLRFCGDLYSWYTLFNSGSNYTYRFYIEISPEIATSLAGNTLTDISFCPYFKTSNTKNGTVFVSENLAADPIVSQDATIRNGFNGSALSVQTVTLDSPYTIKEGVGFAFGFSVSGCSSSDYPLAVDANAPTSFAGGLDVYNGAGTLLASRDVAETGANLFMYANTIGEKKDVNDVFSVNAISLGDYTLPVVDASKGQIDVYALINNLGSNAVTTLEYGYSVNGSEPVFKEINANVAPGVTDVVLLPVETSEVGRGNLQIAISSINGVKLGVGAELSYIALDNDGYKRYFVVEEGTGTGCGYCPRGIVGMETMAEKYPDTFIGIAAHCDWFGTDPMTVSSYQPFLQKYFEGLPSCIINRDPIYNIDPSPDYLEMVYQMWDGQPAAVNVDLMVIKPAEEATDLVVEASAEFAFDDPSASYALAFVITEDGMKGIQTNYYSGSGQSMGGWQNKPQRAQWTYTDTARDIFNVWGLNESIPSSVEKGVAYKYDYSMSMSNVKKLENTSVVALVLDKTTGTILNAKKVKFAEYTDLSGISDISVDADAPAEYYNIQGVRMDADNLPAGLYIIRQGDKVQKTIIR